MLLESKQEDSIHQVLGKMEKLWQFGLSWRWTRRGKPREMHTKVCGGEEWRVVSPLSSRKSNGKVKGMEKKPQMGNQLWWTWASRAFPTLLNVSGRNWIGAEAGEETPWSLKESSGQPSVSLAEKRGPCKGSNFRLASEGITLTLAPAGLPNILIFFPLWNTRLICWTPGVPIAPRHAWTGLSHSSMRESTGFRRSSWACQPWGCFAAAGGLPACRSFNEWCSVWQVACLQVSVTNHASFQ